MPRARPGSGGVAIQAIRNSTIVANTSNADGIGGGSGGGLYYDSGDVELANTVIAGNLENGVGTDDDCFGPFKSLGHVLIQHVDAGCTLIPGQGDLTNVTAGLDALADKGGPIVGASNATVTAKMLTRSPSSGSPLVDAGDPAGCKDQSDVTLVADQRGFLRPVDGPDADAISVCDIGAVEFGSIIDPIFADNFE